MSSTSTTIYDLLLSSADTLEKKANLPKGICRLIMSPSVTREIIGNSELGQRLLGHLIHLRYDSFSNEIHQIGDPSLLRDRPGSSENGNLDLFKWHNAWGTRYQGDTLKTFLSVLKQHEINFSEEYYAKLLPILQSSGMGKSRLVHQFSKRCPAIIFTLRTAGQIGYPPGDVEITEFLHTALCQHRSEQHAIWVALFSAALTKSTLFQAPLSLSFSVVLTAVNSSAPS